MTNTSLETLKETESTSPVPAPFFRNVRWVVPILLVALMGFHVGMNLWWLSADNHPIRTDEEGHMHLARDFYEVMFLNEYASPFLRLIEVLKIPPGNPAHPPLLHILGAVMIAATDYSVDHIAFTNTVMFILVLLGGYLIARRFLDPYSALFVTFVLSFTPLIFAASRYFMTDYLSLAIVVWAVYALMRSDYFRNTPWVFLFGLLNGLGILARTTTFLYYLVPCMAVVLGGVILCLPLRGRPRSALRGLWPLAFNAILALVVTTGVFAPWYLHHLDRMYTYWVYEHLGGTGGPIALTPPPPTEAREITALAPQVEGDEIDIAAPAVPPPSARINWIEKTFRPMVPWRRYPVFVINSAMFLPLFVLSLIGGGLTLWHRRFRNFDTFLLLLWVLSSWAIMTIVLKYATGRYVLQALPPLSLFAAIAILALPWHWPRRVAMILLAALLLFQYGNLTVRAYGAYSNASLPITVDNRMQSLYDDRGLFLYKDRLTLGFSYSRLGAPMKDNFKDRLFFALLREENQRRFLTGEYANYLRLRIRGMEFEERHFWPDPNPFLRSDLPEELAPRRRLRCIGMGMQPQHLMTKLPNADYVVYDVEAHQTAEEKRWLAFFEERDFQLVERFHQERFGMVAARYYGLLARQSRGEAVPIRTPADLERLKLYELFTFIHSNEFEKLSPDFQAFARERLQHMIEDGANPFPINENVTFITATVNQIERNVYRFRMIFRVEKPFDRDYRIYFHGRVDKKDIDELPENRREQGFMDWNFSPDPPTSSWPAGDYVIINHQITAKQIPYWFQFGFFLDDQYFGKTVQLGWVDFSTVP
jgi:hypothetical protein